MTLVERKSLKWIRRNLLKTPLDWFMTSLICGVCLWLLPTLWNWLIWDATFLGLTRKDCVGEGACWPFVWSRIGQFLFGFYPETQRWRLLLLLIWPLVFGMIMYFFRKSWPRRLGGMTAGVLGFPVFSWFVLKGGSWGLEPVDTAQWGGLLLTLFISLCGIFWSLPLGVALALGRQSKRPLVHKASVAFIELWRGVPLITILFLASVMIPLFFPKDFNFDKLLRAVIGVTLFASAYMAEVVRAGLNGVSLGQYEAAYSLGLGWFRTMLLVVLPQALKMSIPGIVNTFIGLFKDTSLVLIIGMFDLMGMIQAASTDSEWLGCTYEGYFFAGLVYWVFCFTMSRTSLRLEARLQRQRSS